MRSIDSMALKYMELHIGGCHLHSTFVHPSCFPRFVCQYRHLTHSWVTWVITQLHCVPDKVRRFLILPPL